MKTQKAKKKIICEYHGYGKNDVREGSHLIQQIDKKVCSTITTLVSFNKVVVEIYEDDE